MLRLKSFYYFTIALVFFGLLAAGMILLPRIGMEMGSNIVAQAVRYRDCYELINAAGKYTTDVEEYYNLEKICCKNCTNGELIPLLCMMPHCRVWPVPVLLN